MERGDHAERMTEIEMCLVYEKGKACRGAGGRKVRSVCIYCPNYERWQEKREEEKTHGSENKNIH